MMGSGAIAVTDVEVTVVLNGEPHPYAKSISNCGEPGDSSDG